MVRQPSGSFGNFFGLHNVQILCEENWKPSYSPYVDAMAKDRTRRIG
jgi:hypothetical protein